MRCVSAYFIFVFAVAESLNLEYLDPEKLQTVVPAETQQNTVTNIISKYTSAIQVVVTVNPRYFNENKDSFTLRTDKGQLHIKASTGVAALWGFNYYLKKYCKSQIAWQTRRIVIPVPLPEVDEYVVANDRFRYYQNVCTASYSFVWWQSPDWINHVEWMALNGINLVLAPVTQEAAWMRVYRQLGLTDDEINQHFTGPAFLSWQRMGNVHGWGGPLLQSWLDTQGYIQENVVSLMYNLGMVPVMPTFNGHVPKAFSRVFPNSTFYNVGSWNKFDNNYSGGLFMDPTDDLFVRVGKMFLEEVTDHSALASHIYTADPFNEVKTQSWSTGFVVDTAKAIYRTVSEFDSSAVWLLQNWMFVSDPVWWPVSRVQSFLTSVPNGRMLILDLQSEQWPQYDLYEMYYGQPFIWCMLHNFGGTLGMFGNMVTINKDVYEVRARTNSTMIGVGLTPEGINQNYVVYDLMLESAWRKGPVELETWAGEYAERRYGCNSTSNAWRYLLKSVYSFNSLHRVRGKYVVTRRPSFKITPWAWYSSHDLFEAFKSMVTNNFACQSDGFTYDVVDVARQALQYRAEQLYVNIQQVRSSNSWVVNASISLFLDAMTDMKSILYTNRYFMASDWVNSANRFSKYAQDSYLYGLNSRNQITLWGPNGEISDYACKQWAEMFHYYYIPRWSGFLNAYLDAKLKGEIFDEKSVQNIIRTTVEMRFMDAELRPDRPQGNSLDMALALYYKWAFVPGLPDLPQAFIKPNSKKTTMADFDFDTNEIDEHTVVMSQSTTPTS